MLRVLGFDPVAGLANLGDLALKGLVILIVAELVALTLRRRSSETRHLALTLAATALLLPPLQAAVAWPFAGVLPTREVAPVIPLAVRPAPTRIVPAVEPTPPARQELLREPLAEATVPPRVVAPSAVAPPPRRGPVAARSAVLSPGWAVAGLTVWLIGAVVTFAPWVIGTWSARQRGRKAVPIESGLWFDEVQATCEALGIRRRVELRVGPAGTMPATWGVRQPVVILPADAETWPAAVVRSTLRHELAHAWRGDFFMQGVIRLACAVHWFNPLAWRLDRRVRAEAERASDDIVLRLGTRPSDYASDLLSVVRSAQRRGGPSVVTMASPGSIAGRIDAILAPNRDRRGVSRRGSVVAALIVVAATEPLGLVRLVPRAAAQPSSPVVARPLAANPPQPAPRVVLAAEPTPPAQVPAPPVVLPDSAWRKTLPGGMVVEVLGLQAEPDERDGWKPDGTLKVETPWWAPDGSPLREAPPGKSSMNHSPEKGMKLRKVAVRTSGEPDDVYYEWKIIPNGRGGGGSNVGLKADDGRSAIHRFTAVTPNNQATMGLRFGIASGQWKVEAKSDGRGGYSIQKNGENNEQVMISFTTAREAEGRTTIVVIDTLRSEDQVRVVAIDRSGNSHNARSGTGSANGVFREQDEEFGLPLAEIARFEFQRRPFARVEFSGLALEPTGDPALKPEAPKSARRADRSRSRLQLRLVAGAAGNSTGNDDMFRRIGPERIAPPPITALEADAVLDDADVARVEAVGWGNDGWNVRFTFTEAGANAFEALNRANPHRRLATVVDGRVLDASLLDGPPGPLEPPNRPVARDFDTGRLDEFDARSIVATVLDVIEPDRPHPQPSQATVSSTPQQVMAASEAQGHTLRFGEEGRTLVALGRIDRETIGEQTWDVATGALLRTQPFPQGATRGLAATPPWAAGRLRDGSVRIWPSGPRDGTIVREVTIPTPHGKSTSGAAIAPVDDRGTLLATWGVYHTEKGGDQDEIKVWDAATGTLLRTHRDVRVYALAFAPVGKIMASAGSDRRVTLWASDSGQVLRTLEGHRGSILALAFSPDRRTLATGDQILSGRSESSGGRIGWREVAGEVKLWDVATGSLIRTFTGLPGGVGAVAVAPDGSKVAAGTSSTGVIHVWDTATGARVRSFGIFNVGVADLAFAPEGRKLATVGTEGVIRLWSLAE